MPAVEGRRRFLPRSDGMLGPEFSNALGKFPLAGRIVGLAGVPILPDQRGFDLCQSDRFWVAERKP